MKIYGYPGKDDLKTVNQVIDDLKSLTRLDIQLVDSEENIYLSFLPEKNFKGILKQYRPVNYGFFWTWWKPDYYIYQAVILISTTKINQVEREHLIREELTQALGLMKDSARYQESIFQASWTRTTTFTPLDKAVIKILYDPRITPGMTREMVTNAFSK